VLLSFLPSSSTTSNGDRAQLDEPQQNDESEEQASQEDEETRLLEKPLSKNISLSQVLLRPSTSFFLLSITLIGMVFSLIQSFLFIYMSSELQISPSIIGLTTPLSILLELPVFYYSEKLINVAGTTMMIVLVHVLLIARLLIYTVLNQKSAIFILPVELIHGLAFALTWAAGLENSKRIAPENNKSTFVSIFCTLYNNVGGFLGTYIGGKIYQDYGHIYLWIFCILLLFISIISFLVSIRGDSLRENRTET
jgi:predicted MFS family arabinose efflux permease